MIRPHHGRPADAIAPIRRCFVLFTMTSVLLPSPLMAVWPAADDQEITGAGNVRSRPRHVSVFEPRRYFFGSGPGIAAQYS